MTLDKQLLLIGMYSESGKHVDFEASALHFAGH